MRSASLLLALLLLAQPAAAGDDPALLRALANESADGYDVALETWEALGEARKVELLREALHGEDDELAALAAWGLGPDCLSWSEIRRLMDFLVRDPARLVAESRPEWAVGGWFGLGGPDVVPLFRHAAADPEFAHDPDAWQHVHRAASPKHIPELVTLLDGAHGGIYGELVGLLALLAAYDGADTHRALLARAFLHSDEREEAEQAERASVSFADVAVVLSLDGGLPPAFVKLVEPAGSASVHWLRRWAGELEAGLRDVPLLMRLVDREDSYFPFWALRQLARIGGPEVRAFLEEIVEGGRWTGIFAAAALHEAGESTHWKALLADEKERVHARRVAWVVAPEWARVAWLADPSDEVETMRRYAASVYEGIEIQRADMAWIAEQMLRPEHSSLERARFFTETYSRGLTGDLVSEIVPALQQASEDDLLSLDLDLTFGILEVSAPAALRVLLEARVDGLPWLGDAADKLDAAPVNREALEAKVRSDDVDVAREALRRLAVLHGVPARLARTVFEFDLDASLDDEPWSTVRRSMLEGDPVAALLHLHEQEEMPELHELGLLDDERVRAVLHRYRKERHHGLYWHATAGLAIAGDEDARAEFLAFLEDDRTWMLDNLADRPLCLEGDRRLIPFWLSRLDTNCCTQFHAVTALTTILPTLPFEQQFGLPLFAPVSRWVREAQGRGLAWSRILNGWVPRAKGP